jgi:hypothetical protein
MNTLPTRNAAVTRWLWFAGGIALANAVALVLWYWSSGGLPYDTTSGIWTALADDVAHGEFYRAVHGPTGYGGTRYMPLFFLLQGGLMHAGFSAVSSGLMLTLASLALLAVGTYVLMRRLRVGASTAWPMLGVLSASISLQLLAIAAKGDLLAAALNVWGFALAIESSRATSRSVRAAGWLLGLAVLTKFTEVFALFALVVWLARRREGTTLRRLLVAAGSLALAGLALTSWLSAGRIWENFAVCATGGASAGYVWRFPLWFAGALGEDPFLAAFFLLGVAAAFLRWRREGFDLVVTYFAVTALGTAALFASPGVDSNHFADLLVACVALLAVEISAGRVDRRLVSWLALTLGGAIAASCLPGIISVRHFFAARGSVTQTAVSEVARRLPAGATERLLSENPLLPVVLGQRSEVLDAFSLRLAAARQPEIRAAFFDRLNGRAYRAVVLMDWSGAPVEERWRAIERHASRGVPQFYGGMNFPPGFLDVLRENYRLSFVVPPFVVFEPRSPAP